MIGIFTKVRGYGVPLLCLFLLGLAGFMLREPHNEQVTRLPALLVLCVDSLRQPVEEIADAFQRRAGVQVKVDYGTPDVLLKYIMESGEGDVFLSDNAFHIETLAQKGFVSDLHPVILANSATAVVLAASLADDSALEFVRFLEGPVARKIFNIK